MATSIAENRWYHVGPHGFYDLVRLARRGRSTLVRVSYVLALFAALAGVYYNTHENELHAYGRRHSESINVNARIAERFSITILMMQNLAVFLLIPIYVNAGVHEERDKRTLPLLFTTHLSAREIVRGKWLSRVGHVGGVLLGGLPVLSFVQLWGGIDMPMIAANFCNTGLWLFSVAAFSLMMATRSRTLIRSIVESYLFLLGAIMIVACCCLPHEIHGEFVFLLRPIGHGADGYWFMGMVVGLLAVLHLSLTYFFLWRAAINLEAQRGEDPMSPQLFDPVDGPQPSAVNQEIPSVPDNALVWKEQGPRSLLGGLPLLFLPYLFCLFIIHSTAWTNEYNVEHRSPMFNGSVELLEMILLLSFGIYVVLVTFRLTGCIVRERERQTLESLLTLPIDRREILIAKFKGNMLRYWTWLLPFGLTWLILVLMSGRNPVGGILLLFAVASHFLLFAMLGIFLSVICRTSVSAYVSLGVTLLLLCIGTVFAAMLLKPSSESSWLIRGLNPVGCWLTIANDWRTTGLESGTIACLMGYALAAFALWKLACWRFGRMPSTM